MDEINNLAPRDRSNMNPLETSQNRSPFLAMDMMPREPHLLDYLLVLRKHQWLIAFFLLAVVSIVTIATFRMKPVYQATARVEIDRENANAIHFSDSDQFDMSDDINDYITTQSKILQSQTLAMLTVKSLGLDRLNLAGSRENRLKPRRREAIPACGSHRHSACSWPT